MAGNTTMLVTPVDQDCNLFRITDLIPQSLMEKILQTQWMSLDYTLQEGNRNLRRRIRDNQLPWLGEWHDCIHTKWHSITQQTGCNHLQYVDTGFWVDQETYTCPIHTDGELPGSMQMFWIGNSTDIGTTWYYYRDHPDKVRYAFEFVPNTGYIMINKPEPNGYRKLQWHGMLHPVPDNTIRVSSYSWLGHK